MTSGVQLGEIYIVRVPFVDGGGSKPRPVLITGLPNSKGDVQGIPGSSRLRQWAEPHQVVVAPTDLASGSLDAPTVFPPSKQMVFAPRLFAARGGQVNAACLDQVLRRVVASHVAQYGAMAYPPARSSRG